MIRRDFIKNSMLTFTLGLSGFSLLHSCTSGNKEDKAVAEIEEASFSLEEITIDDLQRKMESGELTSRSITESYLKRIEAMDKNGPKLNSVIEVNPDALAIAEQMDEERRNKKVRGSMHGIPVLIKDNIDTADKMLTTAGSLALAANHASTDAFIVQQLRSAGAIILGKTNLSEWANFRSTRSSSGWSSRGGQTKNPYVLDRSPCGSSSGSGTAVAANLCAIAIGTETDGSISCPASLNGVVGIKPTVGLWSRTGIIPISSSQDTAGPMARTVKDAAILLGILTKIDQQDQKSTGRKTQVPSNYTSFIVDNGLSGKVIGVDKALMKGHEAIDKLLEKAIEQLKSGGATIIPVDFTSKFNSLGEDEYERMLFEFKDGLNQYLGKANAGVKTLEELIVYNKNNEATVMPHFKQEIFEKAQTKEGVNSEAYIAINKKLQSTSRKLFTEIFAEHKLNAVCGPANGPGWCIDLVNGDFFTGYGMYTPAAIAGYPSITVPLGLVNGLPIGISFLGQEFAEGELITIAYGYEQISKNRVPPSYLKGNIGY